MNFLLNERFTYKYAFIKGFRRTKHRLDATSGASARFQIWRHISVSCPCARRRIYSWTESSRFVWAQIFVGFVHSEQIDSSSRLFQVRDQFQKIIIQYLSYFSFKKNNLQSKRSLQEIKFILSNVTDIKKGPYNWKEGSFHRKKIFSTRSVKSTKKEIIHGNFFLYLIIDDHDGQ